MNKYFNKVGVVKDTMNDGKGFVELWSGWNANFSREAREETVATIASLSYGNEAAKNPAKLYKRLQELKHESVFEFINTKLVGKSRIKSSLRHTGFLPYDEEKEELGAEIEPQIEERKANIATFKIKVPIIVARQFMRHRASYLELSRRYVKGSKIPFEFYDFWENLDDSKDVEQIKTKTSEFYESAIKLYDELLELKVPAEKARCVIPQGVYTVFWVQMDTEYLSNFLKLRLKKDAQEEIRYVAKAMYDLIKIHQPALATKIDKDLS